MRNERPSRIPRVRHTPTLSVLFFSLVLSAYSLPTDNENATSALVPDPDDPSRSLVPVTDDPDAPYIVVGDGFEQPYQTGAPQNSCTSCHRAQCDRNFAVPLGELVMPGPFADSTFHDTVSADLQELRDWCKTVPRR